MKFWFFNVLSLSWILTVSVFKHVVLMYSFFTLEAKKESALKFTLHMEDCFLENKVSGNVCVCIKCHKTDLIQSRWLIWEFVCHKILSMFVLWNDWALICDWISLCVCALILYTCTFWNLTFTFDTHLWCINLSPLTFWAWIFDLSMSAIQYL